MHYAIKSTLQNIEMELEDQDMVTMAEYHRQACVTSDVNDVIDGENVERVRLESDAIGATRAVVTVRTNPDVTLRPDAAAS